MELLRSALGQIAPPLAGGGSVSNGILVGATGWALMALPNHTDSPRHFDIGFVPSMDSPQRAVLPDCISGIGDSAQDAAAMMAHVWRETSGACLAEMLTRHGDYAAHLDGSAPSGLPGWHSVVSGVLGYGSDPASSTALQAALLDHEVLRTLAPALVPALDRPAHNAIKVFCHRTPTSTTAEIRVNGVPHRAAARALAAALPWPEVTASTTARFYAVTVHPA
jgi:hypothetical protein